MSKILTSKIELKKKIVELKKRGKKISLVHGVFDILHLGHIYYFNEAKTYADILIVSITADKFVDKGINKPYFNDKDRSVFLKQLSNIDYVFCNHAKDSTEVINIVKPNFYVKGPDYSSEKGDEAGNLKKELNALKKAKGKFVITSGKQYSSTKIINERLPFGDTENNDWLKKIKNDKNNDYLKNFSETIKKINKQKILIIGEIIFDEYNYVEPLGKPSKENILSVNFNKKEVFLGGCLPVAKNISQINKNITLISMYNDKSILFKLKKFFSYNKINLKLFKKNGFKDIYKKRYLNIKNYSKIFEVYDFKNNDFYHEKIYNYLKKNLKNFDQVIVCDFGHGLINKKMANLLTSKSKFISANIQTNSGNRGYNFFTKYNKLDFLSIDEPELRLGVQDKASKLVEIINNLSKKKYRKIMITRGVEGLNYKGEKKMIHIPALTTNPTDTIGAGDAAFSFSACFVKNTKNDNLISLVGAIAGAIKVKIIGHTLGVDVNLSYKSLRSYLK